MTAPMCPSCRGDSADGLLCNRCARVLRTDLGDLNENWVTLQEVIARITKRGDSSGEGSVNFNERASEVGWQVRNTVTTWVRELCTDTAKVRDSMRPMINWLLDNMELVRAHEAAGELMDELQYACRSVRIAIDLPPELRLVGDCPICAAKLMAPLTAQEVTCRRCQKAGVTSTFDVPTMRQALVERVENEHVSRTMALQVVAKVWGIEINGATFRTWLHRGKLVSASVTAAGVPMYRVGAVLDLAQGIEREVEARA